MCRADEHLRASRSKRWESAKMLTSIGYSRSSFLWSERWTQFSVPHIGSYMEQQFMRKSATATAENLRILLVPQSHCATEHVAQRQVHCPCPVGEAGHRRSHERGSRGSAVVPKLFQACDTVRRPCFEKAVEISSMFGSKDNGELGASDEVDGRMRRNPAQRCSHPQSVDIEHQDEMRLCNCSRPVLVECSKSNGAPRRPGLSDFG